MTDIEPVDPRSPARKAELTARLVRVEERALGLVDQGMTAARRAFTMMSEAEYVSPQALLQTASAVEKMHKLAKDICGEPEIATTNNIQVNNIHASEELVTAIAKAYSDVEKGHLERAAKFIEDAEEAGRVIEGEIIPD